MERISHLIEKIRTTYYDNREKTLIDLDLLLDYTRVMYADLLEWRAGLDAASTTPEIAATAAGVPAEEAPEERAPSAQIAPNPPAVAGNLPSETTGHQEEHQFDNSKSSSETARHASEAALHTGGGVATSDGSDPESMERPESADRNKQAAEAPVSPETTIKDDSNETPILSDKSSGAADSNAGPEEQQSTEADTATNKTVERIKNDRSSISFEPPSDASAKSQQGPTRPESPVEEIPVPPASEASEATPVEVASEAAGSTEIPSATQAEATGNAAGNSEPKPLPDFKKIFEKANISGAEERSDIRKLIGINDKYLYLNELFNNHKSEYEETLDHLNKMDSAASARQFLEEEIAPKYKWHAEDGTVESFYWLVERHLKR